MVAVNPPPPTPGPSPQAHVAVLADSVLRLVRARLARQDWNGLRVSHFRLLSTVPSAGTTVTELAGRLSMTKQAVGQFVTGLRASGHLDVTTDAGDRRRRIVVRTATGDATVAAVDAAVAELEREWAGRVGPDRYAVFLGVLAELAGGAAES
jgi:DNA-binding MarR family transcriptional regulator